jgi:ABC-type hemin transport system ATPase subunit
MRLQTARFQEFTVFADARFNFVSGINVLLGENGTGKSHVLKALYGLCVMSWPKAAGVGDHTGEAAIAKRDRVQELFGPDALSHLVRVEGEWRPETAEIEAKWDDATEFALSFSTRDDGMGFHYSSSLSGTPLFIPPREVLSMYPGFASLYRRYRLAFDRTYLDLCEALAVPLLRELPPALAAICASLESTLGGRVMLKNDRFYIVRPDGEREITLEAEGLRKLAMVLHLIANGQIEPGGYLFWDEPEANMNPRLVLVMRDLLLGLADAGVQVFVATHDYLLSRELSLVTEYGDRPDRLRFFCLHKATPDGSVAVEEGATLVDLEHNPIVAEFAAHYARENERFVSSSHEG